MGLTNPGHTPHIRRTARGSYGRVGTHVYGAAPRRPDPTGLTPGTSTAALASDSGATRSSPGSGLLRAWLTSSGGGCRTYGLRRRPPSSQLQGHALTWELPLQRRSPLLSLAIPATPGRADAVHVRGHQVEEPPVHAGQPAWLLHATHDHTSARRRLARVKSPSLRAECGTPRRTGLHAAAWRICQRCSFPPAHAAS